MDLWERGERDKRVGGKETAVRIYCMRGEFLKIHLVVIYYKKNLLKEK